LHRYCCLAHWSRAARRLSSVGQSNALVMRRSRVRIPKAALWKPQDSLAVTWGFCFSVTFRGRGWSAQRAHRRRCEAEVRPFLQRRCRGVARTCEPGAGETAVALFDLHKRRGWLVTSRRRCQGVQIGWIRGTWTWNAAWLWQQLVSPSLSVTGPRAAVTCENSAERSRRTGTPPWRTRRLRLRAGLAEASSREGSGRLSQGGGGPPCHRHRLRCGAGRGP
jgi:hypothetical protein